MKIIIKKKIENYFRKKCKDEIPKPTSTEK